MPIWIQLHNGLQSSGIRADLHEGNWLVSLVSPLPIMLDKHIKRAEGNLYFRRRSMWR